MSEEHELSIALSPFFAKRKVDVETNRSTGLAISRKHE
jgi:hypothetical protein